MIKMEKIKTLEAKTAKNVFKIPKAEIKKGRFVGEGSLEAKEGDILLVEGRKELIIKADKEYYSYGHDEDGDPSHSCWKVSLETIGRFEKAIYISKYDSESYSGDGLFIKDISKTLMEGLSDEYSKYDKQLKKVKL